jgi:hypothetical protein
MRACRAVRQTRRCRVWKHGSGGDSSWERKTCNEPARHWFTATTSVNFTRSALVTFSKRSRFLNNESADIVFCTHATNDTRTHAIHWHAHDRACTHVRVYACTHVRMYACTLVRMYACTHVRVYACTHVRTYACTHVRVYACTHAEPRTQRDIAALQNT